MSLSVQICAITFIGNASNGLQQDAFAINNDWYQTKLGVTEVLQANEAFCVAVADGVAASNKSQYVAKAVAQSVAQQWQNKHDINMADIHQNVNRLADKSSKYIGASSTLAVAYRPDDKPNTVFIKHVGDSRVYLFRANNWRESHWQCLTDDHNVMNQIIKEQSVQTGVTLDTNQLNKDGMAGSLYSLTECFHADSDTDTNPVPDYDSQSLSVQAGDVLLVCSDGIHDLVPSEAWQGIDENTDLQDWLKTLKTKVYEAQGNAYDNGTAIVVRF